MTPEQLIKIWGDRKKLADAIGAGETTVRAWFNRKSIPTQYDRAIMLAASEAGKPVTPSDLHMVRQHLHSQKNTGAVV